MVLSGQHEFAAFCMQYPGESRYQMACQGSELIVGLGKMYCEKCGTGKFDMPTKLGNYYDITGTSMVYHNKVDFSKILKSLDKEKLLLFDWKETPFEEYEIEKLLPPLMKYIVQLLDNLKVGDKLPVFITQILTQLDLDIWSLQIDNVAKLLIDSHNSSINKDTGIFDPNSAQYKDCIAQLNELKKNEDKKMANSLKVQSVIVNQSLAGI